jgi:hypothetical protein
MELSIRTLIKGEGKVSYAVMFFNLNNAYQLCVTVKCVYVLRINKEWQGGLVIVKLIKWLLREPW